MTGYAPLGLYRHHLDNILRTKAHTLSESEEKILAEASQVTRAPGNIFNMLETADLKYGNVVDEQGDTVQLTKERYSKFLESTDRRLRREANFTYNDAYEKLQNTFNASYSASVRGDIFYCRRRASTRRCWPCAWMRYNIPVAVYENLITDRARQPQPYHDYQALRKKVMGLDTLHGYDTYVPLVPDAKIEFTYEQAKRGGAEGAEAAGPEVQQGPGHGAGGGMGRRVRDRGEGLRRLQLGLVFHASLRADELQRHAGEHVHARPRDGARHARLLLARQPAVRLRRQSYVHRRGGEHDQRSA